MRVLSDQQFAFWKDNGYVIVPNAVPPENLTAVTDAIWEFQEMNPNDPTTWYRTPERANEMVELNRSGMVELYHHQALWNNRQHPRVYDAFVDIWETEKLWVTIDRANLNIPAKPEWDFKGFIHWDIDTGIVPTPFDVQGVLSLTDTVPGQGGFQCVPGFPKQFDEWVKTQPDDRDTWKPDLTNLEVKKIETKAGDLLIWNSLLPHGTGRNDSDKPRLAQYISMSPAKEDNTALREWRVRSWQDRLAPEGFAFPGDPRGLERKYGKTADLTPLGRKLLGVNSWD